MSFINTPLGIVLRWLAGIFGGNFAWAVFIFTLLINLVMLPLTIRSQKATADQARLKPKLEAIKRRCGDDKNKFAQEQQALYQKEKVSMAGGCLPLIIRLIIMWAVYDVITSPLLYILSIDKGTIETALNAAVNSGLIKNAAARGSQIELFNLIQNGTVTAKGITPDMLSSVSFDFLGINLTQTPTFSFNIFGGGFQTIWVIPILSFLTAIASSVISMILNKRTNPDAPSMATMMLMMPVISLVIAFTVPGAVGFYWAASNLIACAIQSAVQIVYNPNRIIAKSQITDVVKKYKLEQKTIAEKKASHLN